MTTENLVFQMLKEDLPVKMGSQTCKEHKQTHETCSGCLSNKACKEWMKRIMVYTEATIYPEKYDGEFDE